MRYLVVFNLFCLAVFVQIASQAPLVDENEQPLDQPKPARRDIIRGLIEVVSVKS